MENVSHSTPIYTHAPNMSTAIQWPAHTMKLLKPALIILENNKNEWTGENINQTCWQYSDSVVVVKVLSAKRRLARVLWSM